MPIDSADQRRGSAAFADFVWSVGEEGSDPIVDRDGAPYRHDQFRQSGHDVQVEADLASIADLGVSIIRYGTPWRLAEPEPGVYDWSRWDRAFAACEAAGLEPVVEFLHFGLPDHYPGFVDRQWIEGFRRYVEAFLARYSEPRMFTPINEPGITALLSARFGMWNDQLATAQDHAAAMVNVVVANLEAIAQVRADRGGWWIGSEGFDVPIPTTESDVAEVEKRRAIGWLVWDLHFGKSPQPAAERYLDHIDEQLRRRVDELVVSDQLVAGLDIYPSSVMAVGKGVAPSWSVDERLDFAASEIVRWHDRYDQPFWVAETSNLTLPVADQIRWLDGFAARLQSLRAAGRPARGLCWYSRGDQFDWQTALTNPIGAVTEVGLFDVARQPRPVAARFKQLASGDH